MKSKLLLLLLHVIFILAPFSIFGYKQIEEDGRKLHWNDNQIPVSYMINSLGAPGVDNEFNAVHASFDTWSAVPTSKIAFTFNGLTPISISEFDSINVVTWSDVITTTDLGIAESIAFFSVFDGNFLDVDIILSNFVPWSTTGESEAFDIQSVMTHEVGHMVGLADLFSPADVNSVMYGFINPGDLSDRVLSEDDIAGASAIYPIDGDGGKSNDGGGCGTIKIDNDVFFHANGIMIFFVFIGLLIIRRRRAIKAHSPYHS